ncbi:PspC domain-containing protein [Nocardioides sp.]|uniref:PspC domain-containing protein n=1 Tax=Nocardioides sp. TaxID=35761 RepID=UPI002D803F41|nr:PspC domain-containing protein [Nocardioides sp.]HET8961596.1 PspC domain-containing protein [Nocardioides sp.]
MTTGTPTGPPDAPSGPTDGPAPDELAEGGPRATRDEIRDLGRLRRSVADRKVAGVAGGLARHLDVDPLILRVAFVVLAFFGGAGLLLYGACWLLVPEDGSDTAAITLDDRSRTVALLAVGVLAAFALLGDSWGVFWFPWPLAIIALVVLLFLTRKDRRSAAPPPGSGGPAPVAPGDTSTYEGTTSDGSTWTYQVGSSHRGPGPYADDVPPYQGPTTSYVAPRDPRRRGPILFWFTLALIALAIGILGIVDVAGVAVPPPAYPALVVGLSGLMLLVGAFWGRAGGLILVGLLATVPMVAMTAVGQWDGGDRIRETPPSAAEVENVYDFDAGELVLDLTEVTDVEALDGREIRVEGGAGRIELLVPDDMDVRVTGEVGGPGAITLFGEQQGGIGQTGNGFHNGGTDVPRLTIHAELGIGEIHAESE